MSTRVSSYPLARSADLFCLIALLETCGQRLRNMRISCWCRWTNSAPVWANCAMAPNFPR